MKGNYIVERQDASFTCEILAVIFLSRQLRVFRVSAVGQISDC